MIRRVNFKWRIIRCFFFVFIVLSSCTENEKSISKTNFCSQMSRDKNTTLTKELEDVTNLMEDQTGVYVLEDGSGALVIRAWLTEYAEKTIDIQYFIFSTDNVGLIACDYLIKAADRGVKIRLIVDDIMVDTDVQDLLKFNKHKNIEVKIYNPGVNLGKNIFDKVAAFTTDFRGANQRMHNKTFVVDGKVAITGGRNIANEYFDYNDEFNYRDRDILLVGKESKTVDASFEQFWKSDLCVNITNVIGVEDDNSSGEINFDKLHEYACNPDNFWPEVRERIQNLPVVFKEIKKDKLVWLEDIQFISDVPGKNDGDNGLGGGGVSTTALINLIKEAKSSIDIQTPYLITTELGKKLFKEAIKRGVKIRVLTNSLASTDNIEAFSSYQADREGLLKTGIRIFEFRPDAEERMKILTGELQEKLDYKPIFGLHAKSMVIDKETTVIGTFNLDPRSANLNTECVVILKSDKISQGVLKGMEEEFKPANSWETTLKFNPDAEVSNYKRLKTWTRKILPKEIL